MKGLIKVMLVLSILVFAFSCGANKPYEVYEIHTAQDLIYLSTKTEDFNKVIVKFMDDINMINTTFNGIAKFSGRMEGNGKIIHNLNINEPNEESVGLIWVLGDGGYIENLTIANGSIEGNNYVGAFVGTISDNAAITIIGVTNKANVKASRGIAGGIVGGYPRIVVAKKIEIYDVANFGNVLASDGLGESFAGGIIGWANSSTTITINNAKNSGNVVASSGNVNTIAGGIIGWAKSSTTTTINNAENTGDITVNGDSNGPEQPSSGGIIGLISSYSSVVEIKNAGNTGEIISTVNAGGIIGSCNNTIVRFVYNYGEIVGTRKGGIAGIDNGFASIFPLTINNSYYLENSAYNAVGITSDKEGSKKITTEEFKLPSTFVGWDFNNVWQIVNGKYPTLK